MIALLQRTSEASVEIGGEVAGSIGHGVVVFLGVCKGDGDAAAVKLADKTAGYRILAGDTGRPDKSVAETPGAGLLVISQFTLAADTGKGRRADYGPAAAPAEAERLYALYVARLRERGLTVATGRFGADMRVRLVNEGPVTFWLEVT